MLTSGHAHLGVSLCYPFVMPRGKNKDARYVGIAAQIPKDLRRQFRVKLAMLELDANSALEILVRRFVSGDVVFTSEDFDTLGLQDIPEAIPQPSPVKATPPKTRSPKPSTSPPTDEATTELASICNQLGISGNELARRLDMASGTVSRYVSGKRDTPPEVLKAARELLRRI